LAADRPAETPLPFTRKLPAWTAQPNQPATYPRLFVQVAAERGIAQAEVLRHAGLRPDLLDDPAGRLTLREVWQVVEAVHTLADDPALGFDTGYRLPLTAHGSLGYALLCAPTARAAIAILERFWHLRGRGVLFRFEETDDTVVFEITPELPTPAPLRDFLFSSMLTSMYRGICFLLGSSELPGEIWLQGEAPAGFAAWRERLPMVRFNKPSAQIRLMGDKSPLERALPTANPEGLVQALTQCERESALLADDGHDDIMRRTRAALSLEAHGYPGPVEIAARLHMTPRTFRRRLQEQGSSYTQLLEEARRRDSMRLLENPELEIRQISELLGYADPANFTRAFKGWTGRVPSEWRRPG
jgi:AraC-like DNA-binding protein